MAREFIACKKKVANRGFPPNSFLNELIDWATQAPDEIFVRNNIHDVYSNVAAELGPYTGITAAPVCQARCDFS